MTKVIIGVITFPLILNIYTFKSERVHVINSLGDLTQDDPAVEFVQDVFLADVEFNLSSPSYLSGIMKKLIKYRILNYSYCIPCWSGIVLLIVIG